mgnify:CR=1 FL=1
MKVGTVEVLSVWILFRMGCPKSGQLPGARPVLLWDTGWAGSLFLPLPIVRGCLLLVSHSRLFTPQYRIQRMQELKLKQLA